MFRYFSLKVLIYSLQINLINFYKFYNSLFIMKFIILDLKKVLLTKNFKSYFIKCNINKKKIFEKKVNFDM